MPPQRFPIYVFIVPAFILGFIFLFFHQRPDSSLAALYPTSEDQDDQHHLATDEQTHNDEKEYESYNGQADAGHKKVQLDLAVMSLCPDAVSIDRGK